MPPPAPVVGMVGAGQLARMTSQAATGLGIGFRVLAGSATDSAALVCAGTVIGDYTSLDDLRAFAEGCDVVTFDHEHVPAAHLATLEAAGRQVRPGGAAHWGWPVVLKAVSGGYDGRGVWVCQTPAEAAEVLAHPVGVFAEEYVAFD